MILSSNVLSLISHDGKHVFYPFIYTNIYVPYIDFSFSSLNRVFSLYSQEAKILTFFYVSCRKGDTALFDLFCVLEVKELG